MIRPFQRVALAGVVVACILAAGAYASAFGPDGPPLLAAVILALATALLMASLVVLGGGGRGSAAPSIVAGVTLVGVVGGGVAGSFLIGAPDTGTVLVGGLPPGAALLIYGAGLLPAVVVPLVYAWSFDRTTLPPEVLDEVRRRGREFERTHDDDAVS